MVEVKVRRDRVNVVYIWAAFLTIFHVKSLYSTGQKDRRLF